MKFEEMKRTEQERILMPILIKVLQNLGGKATRKELKHEIKASVTEIPENFIDKTKLAKSGRLYQPFNFLLNFSITNLEMAEFLTCPQRGEVVLTAKGRACNIDTIDIDQDIYSISKQEWKERSAKNRENKSSLVETEYDEELDYEEIDETEDWKKELKKILANMSPKKFETFCRALVRAIGVDIDDEKGTQATHDGGIDGYGYITSDNDFRTSRIAIQAKRWHKDQSIGRPEIDKFVGAMINHNAEFGVFITTAHFTRDAQTLARTGKYPITLIDGDKIIELVEKYQVYIKPAFQLEKFYYEKD